MSKYEYILWDWNGTIVDDVDANIEVEHCLMDKRGLTENRSKEFYLEEFGFPIIEFYEKLGFDFSKESYNAIAYEYADEYDKKIPFLKLFPDVIPVIDSLSAKGIKHVIISATEHNVLLKQVSQFGIADKFEVVLGNMNNLGKSKVQVAVDWLNDNRINPDKVAFIGDTIHDFETASAIGCDCFLVSNGHNSKNRLIKTGCKVFESLSDVSIELLK